MSLSDTGQEQGRKGEVFGGSEPQKGVENLSTVCSTSQKRAAFDVVIL